MKERTDYQYWFLDMVLDERKENAYFSAANMNGLFRWNFQDNSVALLGEFLVSSPENELFQSGILVNEKIFFPPRMADCMAVYDIKNNEISKRQMYPENPYLGVHFQPSKYGYISILEKGKDLYFLYRESPICIKWNIEKDTCSYITCEATGEALTLARDYTKWNGRYYIPSAADNSIIELDTDTDTMKIRTPGEDKEWKYGSIAACYGDIWLMRVDQPVVIRWNPETNKIISMEDILDREDWEYSNCYRLICREKDKGLCLIPGLSVGKSLDDMYSFDLSTGDWEKKTVFHHFGNMKKWPTFSIGNKFGYLLFENFQQQEQLYWLNGAKHVCFDLETETVTEFDLPIPSNWSPEELSQKIDQYQRKKSKICFETRRMEKRPVYETSDMTLEQFLNNVKEMTGEIDNESMKASIGAHIYETLKKELL